MAGTVPAYAFPIIEEGNMATDLTIKVPDDLRAAMEAAAQAEAKTVDAIMQEAGMPS
jgi:hypothetical protein